MTSDLKTNCAIRSILARHWVDLGKIGFAAFKGTVRITGEMAFLGGRPSTCSDAARIGYIEQEIRRVPGVAHLYWELTNATKDDGGRWQFGR